MKNADRPASPIISSGNWKDVDDVGMGYPALKNGFGLTKRERFAMAAMQGLLSAHNHDGVWTGVNVCAEQAVMEADALLSALQGDKPDE